jgi:hypothetical protein
VWHPARDGWGRRRAGQLAVAVEHVDGVLALERTTQSAGVGRRRAGGGGHAGRAAEGAMTQSAVKASTGRPRG